MMVGVEKVRLVLFCGGVIKQRASVKSRDSAHADYRCEAS